METTGILGICILFRQPNILGVLGQGHFTFSVKPADTKRVPVQVLLEVISSQSKNNSERRNCGMMRLILYFSICGLQ